MNPRIGLALFLVIVFLGLPVISYYMGAGITELLLTELIKSDDAENFSKVAGGGDQVLAGLGKLVFGAAFFAAWGATMLIFMLGIQLLILYLVLSGDLAGSVPR